MSTPNFRISRRIDEVPPRGWSLHIDRPRIEWPVTWDHSLCLDYFGSRNVRDYLEERPRMGSLSMDRIISIFIHRHRLPFHAWGWSADKYHEVLIRFFSRERMRLILLAAQQGRVGDVVRSDLETHLARVRVGMDWWEWQKTSGWIKSAILQCFDERDFPDEGWKLLHHYRIPLDQILKLPIRESKEGDVACEIVS